MVLSKPIVKFGHNDDKVTGDITLIAWWMIVNYTVTFDS